MTLQVMRLALGQRHRVALGVQPSSTKRRSLPPGSRDRRNRPFAPSPPNSPSGSHANIFDKERSPWRTTVSSATPGSCRPARHRGHAHSRGGDPQRVQRRGNGGLDSGGLPHPGDPRGHPGRAFYASRWIRGRTPDRGGIDCAPADRRGGQRLAARAIGDAHDAIAARRWVRRRSRRCRRGAGPPDGPARRHRGPGFLSGRCQGLIRVDRPAVRRHDPRRTHRNARWRSRGPRRDVRGPSDGHRPRRYPPEGRCDAIRQTRRREAVLRGTGCRGRAALSEADAFRPADRFWRCSGRAFGLALGSAGEVWAWGASSGTARCSRSGDRHARGAGCVWNDIADRDIDAKVGARRGRRLPAR